MADPLHKLLAVFVQLFTVTNILNLANSLPEARRALDTIVALARCLTMDVRTGPCLGQDLWKGLWNCLMNPRILESLHEMSSILQRVLEKVEILEMVNSSDEYSNAVSANRSLAIALTADIRTAQALEEPDLWRQLVSASTETFLERDLTEGSYSFKSEASGYSELRERIQILERETFKNSEYIKKGFERYQQFEEQIRKEETEKFENLKKEMGKRFEKVHTDFEHENNNIKNLEREMRNMSDHVQILDEMVRKLEDNSSQNLEQEMRDVRDHIRISNCMSDKEISTEMAYEILPTASRLRMDSVVTKCCTVLQRALTVQSCIATFQLAAELELEELWEEVLRFNLQHFGQIYRNTKDYQRLSVYELILLLGSDSLEVSNEGEVFEAIACWIKGDHINRRCHLNALFRQIHLPLCEINALRRMADHHLVHWCKPIQCQVDAMIELVESGSERVEKLARSMRRLKDRTKSVILVMGGTGSSSTVETYDFETRCWTHQQDIQDPPSEETHVFSWRNNILVIEKDARRVRNFNLQTKEWTKRTDMLSARKFFATAIAGDELYAIGGRLKGNIVNTVEVYNFRTDTWRVEAPLITARSGAAGTFVSGTVYCAGGYGETHLNSVEMFNPSQKSWTSIAPMMTARTYHALLSFQNYILAIGGHNGKYLQEVERLDLSTESWTKVRPMITARYGLSAIHQEGIIYCIGGWNGNNYLKTVEAYEVATDTWKPCTRLNFPREYHGACVVQITDGAKSNLFSIGYQVYFSLQPECFF